MKLKMSNYDVQTDPQDSKKLVVKLKGPKDSLYENGIWSINVILPNDYPYQSPSIGFVE